MVPLLSGAVLDATKNMQTMVDSVPPPILTVRTSPVLNGLLYLLKKSNMVPQSKYLPISILTALAISTGEGGIGRTFPCPA
jgi:hypothetical protein